MVKRYSTQYPNKTNGNLFCGKKTLILHYTNTETQVKVLNYFHFFLNNFWNSLK